MNLQQTTERLRLRNYSQHTIRTYLSCLSYFQSYFNDENIDELTKQDLSEFFLHLLDKGYSLSTQNQYINAVKFYYEQVLQKDRTVYYIDRPRKEKKLPIVLSQEEVSQLLNQINNLKHRTMISLLYSCGLRVNELICLKITDIDSSNMQVRICRGKGFKDRYIPLDQKILFLLRKYYKAYHPVKFLFNGQDSEKYSSTSIRKIIKRAAYACKIYKHITPHTF